MIYHADLRREEETDITRLTLDAVHTAVREQLYALWIKSMVWTHIRRPPPTIPRSGKQYSAVNKSITGSHQMCTVTGLQTVTPHNVFHTNGEAEYCICRLNEIIKN